MTLTAFVTLSHSKPSTPAWRSPEHRWYLLPDRHWGVTHVSASVAWAEYPTFSALKAISLGLENRFVHMCTSYERGGSCPGLHRPQSLELSSWQLKCKQYPIALGGVPAWCGWWRLHTSPATNMQSPHTFACPGTHPKLYLQIKYYLWFSLLLKRKTIPDRTHPCLKKKKNHSCTLLVQHNWLVLFAQLLQPHRIYKMHN